MVFCLGGKAPANLEKMLIAMGYSEKAVKEILKWYANDSVKGDLPSSCSGKPKQNC